MCVCVCVCVCVCERERERERERCSHGIVLHCLNCMQTCPEEWEKALGVTKSEKVNDKHTYQKPAIACYFCWFL